MSAANNTAGRSTTRGFSEIRVLPLDDDPNMRSLLDGALNRYRCSGCEVDLVICEPMMEPLSGRAFLHELRRPEWGLDVPVIIMTASSEAQDVALAQQAHCRHGVRGRRWRYRVASTLATGG